MKEISVIFESAEFREVAITSSVPAALAGRRLLRPETCRSAAAHVPRSPRAAAKRARDLIAQLRSAVELEPQVPEIRVLLGMALSSICRRRKQWSNCAKPPARLRIVSSPGSSSASC